MTIVYDPTDTISEDTLREAFGTNGDEPLPETEDAEDTTEEDATEEEPEPEPEPWTPRPHRLPQATAAYPDLATFRTGDHVIYLTDPSESLNSRTHWRIRSTQHERRWGATDEQAAEFDRHGPHSLNLRSMESSRHEWNQQARHYRLAFQPGDVVVWIDPDDGSEHTGMIVLELMEDGSRRHPIPDNGNRVRVLPLDTDPDEWPGFSTANGMPPEDESRLVNVRWDRIVYNAGSLVAEDAPDAPNPRAVRAAATRRASAERRRQEAREQAEEARRQEEEEAEQRARLARTGGLEPGTVCLVVDQLATRGWDTAVAPLPDRTVHDNPWRRSGRLATGLVVIPDPDTSHNPSVVRPTDGEVFVRTVGVALGEEANEANPQGRSLFLPRRALVPVDLGLVEQAEQDAVGEPPMPDLYMVEVQMTVRMPMTGSGPCYSGTRQFVHRAIRDAVPLGDNGQGYIPSVPSDWDEEVTGRPHPTTRVHRAMQENLHVAITNVDYDASWSLSV